MFKIGIIGAGAIVESSHLPVLKTNPAVEVRWIFDISGKRKQLLASMYNIESIDESKLIEAISEVDICLLTIPFGARRKYIQDIAAAGKALYVEKPFALTVKEHEEYCKWFSPYGLAIGFQRREYSLVTQLSAIIHSGIFGKLKKIEFTQGYFTLKGGKGYLSNAQLSGGGVIIESAIHSLDQLLLVTGAKEVRVNRLSSLSKKGIDYDSEFNSTIQSAAGIVDIDCRISTLRNLDNGIKMYFDNAIVQSTTDPQPKIFVKDLTGMHERFIIHSMAMEDGDAKATTVTQSFIYYWSRFLSGLERKEVNMTSGSTSILTTSWIEQIYNRLQLLQ